MKKEASSPFGRLLTLGLLVLLWAAVAEAKFFFLGDGVCRTADGESGTKEDITVDAREECQLACLQQATCVAFEFAPDRADDNCELHTEIITQIRQRDSPRECFVKEFVPFFESTRAQCVAVMVVGVFIMQVLFVLKALLEMYATWHKGQKRRRQNMGSSDVRIFFDDRGYVINETMDARRYQQLDRLVGNLHTLTNLAFGNPTLFKYHKIIQSTAEVADRCADSVRSLLLVDHPDMEAQGTFDRADALLTDLVDRMPPTSDVNQTLKELQGVFAVIYAARYPSAPWLSTSAIRYALAGPSLFGSWWGPSGHGDVPVASLTQRANAQKTRLTDAPAKADHLEPKSVPDGVTVRVSGCLAWLVDLREQFNVRSARTAVGLVVALSSLGLVRFLGIVPALVLLVVLGFQLMFEILRAFELCSRSKLLTNVVRLSMPIALAVVVMVWLDVGGLNPVASNVEIEERFTFLPVPPQYALDKIESQRVYVGFIYGIMHANLAVLCLLPLPVAYGLQGLLVKCCPPMRFLVPQSPVWLHRTLGYMLVGGIGMIGMLWLLFQGNECFLKGNIQTCEAFEPQLLAGIDVYVLRFHIVYPFMFFFIPLMIWGRYQETWGGAVAPEKKIAASRPQSGDNEAPASKRCVFRSAKGAVSFLYRWVMDIVPIAVAAAGCLHVINEQFNIFFPFWFPILGLLLLHVFLKCRSYVASVIGEYPWLGLKKDDEMSEFLRRSWWETAYASHVIAFSAMSAAALFYRFEVFYPIFLTWGMYTLDRLIFVARAYMHRMPIIVAQGTSSYVVNRGEGARAEASHVRLVVKKPPGFSYKAGQWCHLAMPQLGGYWGSPGCCLPLMQWHPFSIASCPSDDYLEFHIAVHTNGAILGTPQLVRVAKADQQNAVKIVRWSKLLDWLCPHRVPYHGSHSTLKGSFTSEPTGMYLTLKGEDGNTVKALRPQMQWSGRLWNLVQWMLQEKGGNRAVPEQCVHIAGPYGTIPFTIEAHRAVMLIGAGVGYPSTGAMLRQILEDNLDRPDDEKKMVCFIWSASKVEQLLLCFPSLLADLTRYVHRRNEKSISGFVGMRGSAGLADLKKWLHIKIFLSSVEAGGFLSVNPENALFSEKDKMGRALQEVRSWLFGSDIARDEGSACMVDADGTYFANGSLGASFPGILQRSLFTQQVVAKGHSLGISYCGPPELCGLIRSDVANAILPVRVEFNAEVAA